MLHIFRSKKFARRTLLGILILIIPAFVMWGSGSVSNRPELIGVIGGHKIYPDDLAKSIQGMKINLLLNYYGNYELYRSLIQNRQLMNRMSWERLVLLDTASREKIKVNNNDVMSLLVRLPLFWDNGVFSRPSYLRIIKSALYMEPREFEEFVRENLKINFLLQDRYKNIKITDDEVLSRYKMLHDKVDISYVIIDKDTFTGVPEPGVEEIERYYAENKQSFYVPLGMEFEYIKFSFGNAEEQEKVMAEIDEVYPLVKDDPAVLKETAEKYNLDHQGPSRVVLGSIIPGITPSKEIYDTAFGLAEGTVSPPQYTNGTPGEAYIFHKIKSIAPRTLTLDEVKGPVSRKIVNDARARLALEKANAVHDEIKKSNVSLEDAAKTMGLSVQKTEGVSSTDYTDTFGAGNLIISAGLEKDPGAVIPPVNTTKGAALVRIDRIIRADEEKFKDEKDSLYNDIRSSKETEAQTRLLQEESRKAELKRSLDSL